MASSAGPDCPEVPRFIVFQVMDKDGKRIVHSGMNPLPLTNSSNTYRPVTYEDFLRICFMVFFTACPKLKSHAYYQAQIVWPGWVQGLGDVASLLRNMPPSFGSTSLYWSPSSSAFVTLNLKKVNSGPRPASSLLERHEPFAFASSSVPAKEAEVVEKGASVATAAASSRDIVYDEKHSYVYNEKHAHGST
ncbi:hypothetical protein EXIGLDRAFT_773004 [Exidia glandulosa HHB12029]|uniref:Uncharacterized protein n=1 Tax=Exidia glandulosa HHB12029 TaxID=1314781 RepID=A0A165F0W5_EXIGL|nr:hypothetical protein EXIGLDRAFT_773004 [Exidia glandulosa HHB12029]